MRLLDRVDKRVIGTLPWGKWAGDPAPAVWSGARVDQEAALGLLTVYGCVRLISDSIATLPLDAYRKEGEQRVEVPLPLWLQTPVIGLDRVSWLTQILSSLLLAGNAYCYVTRGENNAIIELIPLDPAKVNVIRERGQRVVLVNGKPATVDVLHIPGLMLAGAEVGLSPVEYARQSIGLGLAALEYGGRHFGQGATLSGVIETPEEFNADHAKEMAKAWARAHSGPSKAHLPGVLQGGASWKATQLSNEQSQFLETRGFTSAEIAGQMFLVDPTDLGIPVQGTSITYANLEQRSIRRLQITLLPWIVRLEHAFSGLMQKPRYVKFNVNGFLRGDSKTRWENYASGVQNEIIVPNEARALEDMEPLPGGDEVVKKPVPAPTGAPK